MSRRARLFAFAASVAMHGALLVVAASLDRADPEPVAAPLRGDFIRLELRPSGTPREKPAEASRAASDLAIDTVGPQINSSRGSAVPGWAYWKVPWERRPMKARVTSSGAST
ncbi:MAG: hypothetical protein HYV07_17685 [Deltaproteobacteria bacterium]|nr:hypothetical protein [Deltaproteobacteria bacterium]